MTMHDAKILILMPTRGRPWNALTAISSVMRTAHRPRNVFIHIGQDADDEQRFYLHGGCAGINISTCVMPRMSFVDWVNHMVNDCIKGDFLNIFSHVAWLGDDVRYETEGWDTLVTTNPHYIVYGSDGYQNASKATHPFIRTEIIQALGFVAPPELCHYCPDDFMMDLGKELNSIQYDSNIVTEHFHPDADENIPLDFTYKEAHLAYWGRDITTYKQVIRPKIAEYAAKVKAHIAHESTAKS